MLVDLAAIPLLACAFAVVLGFALASLGSAAGGINFVLGLRFLDFFPAFPPVAKVLSGTSLLAFAAFLAVSALLFWRLFRTAWQRFWSWQRAAWSGIFIKLAAVPAGPDRAAGLRAFVRPLVLSGYVFLGLLAATCALMFVLARGPFWHVWRWFT